MFFAPNPGIMSAGALTGKTYAEFVAHITARATDGSRSWTSTSVGSGSVARKHITTASASVSGTDMIGTPWVSQNGVSRSQGPIHRVIQHCMPSFTVFSAQISGGLVIYYSITAAVPKSDLLGLDRNNYQSIGEAGTINSSLVDEVLLWDDGPRRMQPSLGLGPEPYDW